MYCRSDSVLVISHSVNSLGYKTYKNHSGTPRKEKEWHSMVGAETKKKTILIKKENFILKGEVLWENGLAFLCANFYHLISEIVFRDITRLLVVHRAIWFCSNYVNKSSSKVMFILPIAFIC